MQDIVSDFRTRIQAVTPNPFGNFTGPTLDITPRLDGTNVNLDIRVATECLSFFFSTAFDVDGVQTDAEIPLHQRSRNVSTFSVPAGQTLVLGDMLEEGASASDKGLPLLGNIPVIGQLFHKHFDPTKQNLVVFITPTIIGGD